MQFLSISSPRSLHHGTSRYYLRVKPTQRRTDRLDQKPPIPSDPSPPISIEPVSIGSSIFRAANPQKPPAAPQPYDLSLISKASQQPSFFTCMPFCPDLYSPSQADTPQISGSASLSSSSSSSSPFSPLSSSSQLSAARHSFSFFPSPSRHTARVNGICIAPGFPTWIGLPLVTSDCQANLERRQNGKHVHLTPHPALPCEPTIPFPFSRDQSITFRIVLL